jgi:hypothetical protein
MQHEPFGINSAADAANISALRQAICGEPRIEIVWNGVLPLVHAQIFSTNRVPRSSWTGVSRGEPHFPLRA